MAYGPPPDLRPIHVPLRRIVVVLVAGLALLVAVVNACSAIVTDPGPHLAILDSLTIPRSWTLAESDTVRNVMFGSRVVRYYLVAIPPEGLVEPASQMLQAAGVVLRSNKAPADWCDDRPPQMTPRLVCPERIVPPCGGPNDLNVPTTCYIMGDRDRDVVQVLISGPQELTAFYGEHGRVVTPVHFEAVVRISVYY